MALGDPYATTAELKTRLGITDSTDDTQLGEALSVASRAVEKVCRRQFNKTTTASARVYDPDHCHLVVVDDFHTTTDLAVKYDSAADGTYETTVTSANYELRPLNGIVDGESGWPYWQIHAVNLAFPTGTGRASMQVTAQWGWNAVPAGVKEATLVVAEETFKLKDAPFGVAGFAEFGVVRLRQNPKAMEWLTPYRRTAILVG